MEGRARIAGLVPRQPRRRLGEVAGEQRARAAEIGEIAEPRVGRLLRPDAEREQGDPGGREQAEDEERDEQLGEGEAALVIPGEDGERDLRGGGVLAQAGVPLHPLAGPPPLPPG